MAFTGAGRSATAKELAGLGRGGHTHSRDIVDNTIDGLFATDAALASAVSGSSLLDNTVQALTAGAAIACDASLGHVATLAMSETDATQTITISNLTAGQSMTFFVTQAAAGSKALVFASTFFAGGTEPTQTATASAVDAYTVVKIGSQLYGFVAGQDLKT